MKKITSKIAIYEIYSYCMEIYIFIKSLNSHLKTTSTKTTQKQFKNIDTCKKLSGNLKFR